MIDRFAEDDNAYLQRQGCPGHFGPWVQVSPVVWACHHVATGEPIATVEQAMGGGWTWLTWFGGAKDAWEEVPGRSAKTPEQGMADAEYHLRTTHGMWRVEVP